MLACRHKPELAGNLALRVPAPRRLVGEPRNRLHCDMVFGRVAIHSIHIGESSKSVAHIVTKAYGRPRWFKRFRMLQFVSVADSPRFQLLELNP